ncbi:hypothetical protein EDD36DRAFT_321287 [Exophiala viscosa]|uniref:Uncharacterized protein n=1 Tax=Exophiala viscosa TaxID=2486360 RepID=A0AAN6DRI0_9EURO|nr:hypothetical protein EDD36DRAFT_321287 [Exophiala viscosa]
MCFKGPLTRHCVQCRTLIREDPKYQSYCYSMVLTCQCDRQVTREPFEWTKVFKDVCVQCKAGRDGDSQLVKVKIRPVVRSQDDVGNPSIQRKSLNPLRPPMTERQPDRYNSTEHMGRLSPDRALVQFFAWDSGLIFAVIAIALLLSIGSTSELASWHE